MNRTDVQSVWGRGLWLAAILASSGCYVTVPIKPSELALLDGYKDGEPKGGTVTVLTPTDQRIEIADNSKIFLDLPQGTCGGRFKSIQVRDGLFFGQTEDGQAMRVPLGSVRAARVNEPNPLAFVAEVMLGTTAIVVLTLTGFFLYRVYEIKPE